MSLNTRDTYEKLDIKHKAYSKYSYEVIRKDFQTYWESVDYLNFVYDNHGDIISAFDNYKISTHSQTHKDSVRVYCSDQKAVYNIFGLLLLDDEKITDEQEEFISEIHERISELESLIQNLEILLVRLQGKLISHSDEMTRYFVNTFEALDDIKSEIKSLRMD